MNNDEKDKNWSEVDQARYDKYLRKFCDNFINGMKQVKDENVGFIFIFVRSPEVESIDIANNLNDEQLISTLKEAIKMIESRR